jgi:hypothetical protein
MYNHDVVASISSPSAPPTITVQPVVITVPEHGTANFWCQGNGSMPIFVLWRLQGNQPLPRGVVQNGNQLAFDETRQDLAGQYECVISNSEGTASATVQLIVLCELHLIQLFSGANWFHCVLHVDLPVELRKYVLQLHNYLHFPNPCQLVRVLSRNSSWGGSSQIA